MALTRAEPPHFIAHFGTQSVREKEYKTSCYGCSTAKPTTPYFQLIESIQFLNRTLVIRDIIEPKQMI